MNLKKALSIGVIITATLITVIYFVIFNKDTKKDDTKFKEVTLRLQWHTQAQLAGYYVALDKGFYQDEG